MRKLFGSRSQNVGLAPGTLLHIGEQKTSETRLTLFEYGAEGQLVERRVDSGVARLSLRGRPGVTWLDVDGIHEVKVIEQIGQSLGVHPLVLEDVLNTHQRPKVEDFGDYVYIVLKALYWNEETAVEADQISFILGESYVVSFQEGESEVFEHVKRRLREDKGRIRKMGADYLAYSLLDAIVDHYFLVLESLGERVALLEEALVADPTAGTLQMIHSLKQETIFMRKSVWPLREVIGELERQETAFFGEATQVYLRDVYDHLIQVIEAVETFRDMISGMLDIYLSSVSNKMNEVMKVLTIISTMFIPLTFVAGVYGMNFVNMPELHWRWGYFVVWLVMLVILVSMVVYFKRKKWL